jgi:hypothetical protein
VISTLPEVLPIAAGAKLVVNFALCPTANVNGSDGAFISKPLPDTDAWVIVKAALLEFVTVTILLLLEPRGTLPKLTFVGLTERLAGATHPDWRRAAYNTATRIGSL